MNIHLLDVLTILCMGLMIGNELAVSLFVNPVVWKLDSGAAAKLLAQSLGKYMPGWYIASFLLLATEALLRRHEAGWTLLLIATLSFIAIIVVTLLALVPVNNRVAASTPDAASSPWRQDHKTWDTRHRWRVLFLTGTLACFLFGILQNHA